MSDTELAMEKVQRVSGNMGYVLMGLGNALMIFFLITIGIDNQNVFADLIWCIVLDTAAIVLTVYMWRKHEKETS